MGKTIIGWNTGRTYSPEGQRIKATEIKPGVIVFADLARHIDGVIEGGECSNVSVMYHYDHGYYRGTTHPEEFEAANMLRTFANQEQRA